MGAMVFSPDIQGENVASQVNTNQVIRGTPYLILFATIPIESIHGTGNILFVCLFRVRSAQSNSGGDRKKTVEFEAGHLVAICLPTLWCLLRGEA